jgi:hypothetical protein
MSIAVLTNGGDGRFLLAWPCLARRFRATAAFLAVGFFLAAGRRFAADADFLTAGGMGCLRVERRTKNEEPRTAFFVLRS